MIEIYKNNNKSDVLSGERQHMNKNDKLVVIIGIIILIISSIGIFTFAPGYIPSESKEIKDFLKITGKFSQDLTFRF